MAMSFWDVILAQKMGNTEGDTPTPTLISKSITANDTYLPASDNADGYNSVSVNVPNTPIAKGDVTFYDYDGTIVASYTKEEFLALSALPAGPQHAGLTSQGWNWTLANAKAQVTNHGKLNIGQVYKPTDGATKVIVEIPEGRTSLAIMLYITTGSSVEVDWGDGTTPNTMTANNANATQGHSYATPGKYTISLAVTGTATIPTTGSGSNGRCRLLLKTADSGSGTLDTEAVFRNAIKGIHYGDNLYYSDYELRRCGGLEFVTLPNGTTGIPQSFFESCTALRTLIVPATVTTLSTTVCRYCYGLTTVSLPMGITAGSGIVDSCTSLEELYLPDDMVLNGTSSFGGCTALKRINLPSRLTTLPGGTFSGCSTLESVNMPSGLTTLGNQNFYNCTSLSHIDIPEGITALDTQTFANCYGLGYIKFYSETPPTASNSNVFSNVPRDCVIYVPTGTLTAYTSAQNYPSSSNYTYTEY